MTGLRVQSPQLWILSAEERLPVWATLSTALQSVLDRRLFRGRGLRDVQRANLEVVINTCDLRTGTAFRFGSRHSGAWRYGRISDADSFPIAKAVAASAAFPVLLPPLIETFNFVRGETAPKAFEIALSDGGVFDNLGINVLEPGRNPSISVNVSDVTHILCLNAGTGQFPIGPRTLWLMPRLKQAFEIAHRRVQEAAYSRLHRLVESGLLSGFVMAYLGQDDAKLPAPPPDLVPRSAVQDYPTDFSAMPEESIDLLATRGEQLTRLLVSRYLADA
jgi:NTE family protein